MTYHPVYAWIYAVVACYYTEPVIKAWADWKKNSRYASMGTSLAYGKSTYDRLLDGPPPAKGQGQSSILSGLIINSNNGGTLESAVERALSRYTTENNFKNQRHITALTCKYVDELSNTDGAKRCHSSVATYKRDIQTISNYITTEVILK